MCLGTGGQDGSGSRICTKKESSSTRSKTGTGQGAVLGTSAEGTQMLFGMVSFAWASRIVEVIANAELRVVRSSA
jgi:hypothetical protein